MNISNIKEFRELEKEKLKIIKRENELTTPLLTDFSLVKTISRYFWKIMEERKHSLVNSIAFQRKMFLFILIYLYSPKYFYNNNMAHGFRKVISELFEYNSESAISNMGRDIVSQYLIYKDLRNDIDDIIRELVSMMKLGGIMNTKD